MKSFWTQVLIILIIVSACSKHKAPNIKKPIPEKIIPTEFPFYKAEIKKDTIINDPFYTKNWGLKAINADQAWKTENKNQKNLVIAIIDTGIDVNHEELKNKIWINTKEIAGNSIDDDNNGLVDDIHGWNFVSNNNDVTDHAGHGTHVAGIIGAENNNNTGTAGIVQNVSFMVLKYYDPESDNKNIFKASLSALEYAINNGAEIINYSGGGEGFSQEEFDLVKKAEQKGIIIVTASGNNGKNIENNPYYPASYKLDNIISVSAINKNHELGEYSNYGKTIDISAPGENIYSTLPNNKYGYFTGTSQATAFVTGTVALIKSQNSSLNFLQIKNIIKYNKEKVNNYLTKANTLDIINCLANLKNTNLENFTKKGEKQLAFK